MNKKLIAAILFGAAAVSAAALAGCNIGEINSDSRPRQDNMCFDLKADGTYELTRYEYAELNDREEDDGTVTEGYKGEGETVTVPDKVRGRAVTSIDSGAFSGRGVKEVTLPGAITTLPDGIFNGCTLLKEVNFSSVTSVGHAAFLNCKSLESIEFKSGLTEIDSRAFDGCSKLATVTLPDTVKTLGDDCFRDCPIESLNTAAVETIGESAFHQCGNLTTLDTSNVLSIGAEAFFRCDNLTSLDMPEIVSIGEDAFEGCDKLTRISIGDKLESCQAKFSSVTSVSINSPVTDEMFGEKVTEATLGDGVTSIGKKAFYACGGLESVTLPATLTHIGEGAFCYCGLTGELTIPASVKSVGKQAFKNNQISSLKLGAGVKSLGDEAFCGCYALKSISLNEGLETLGASAFYIKGDENLEIILPSTVKSLGEACFAGVTAKSIVINDTVENVGKNILKNCKVGALTAPANYGHNPYDVATLTLFGEGDVPANAYKNCASLKTVNLSDGVKSIGANAFKGLEKINLNGVEFIGEEALGDLSALTYTKTENGVNYIDSWVISSDYSQGGAAQVDLSGVTGVYEHAFKKTAANDTSALTTVFLTDPEGGSKLKQIGRYAFEGTGVTGVQIPASLKNWNYAFAGCSKLNAVAFDKGIEKIADGAFINCTDLSGFNFANTDIKEIGGYAFSGCKNLSLITLPNGIKKIGDYAFRNCASLLTADLKGTEEIGEYAFFYCASLSGVTMNSVKTIGGYAFRSCDGLTEFDLPVTLTEICRYALNDAETINYAGTSEQWEAIVKGGDKYTAPNGKSIWYGYNDLIIIFTDGSSVTYSKNAN